MKAIHAILQTGLISALLLGSLACDPKKGPQSPQVTMPVSEIVVSTYENSGTRIRATDSYGRIITEGHLLDARSKYYTSKGFVAFTTNIGGRRLHTFNYRGEKLPTDVIRLSRRSRILISDALIAITTEERMTRLYAFTVDGIPVNTSDAPLSRDPDIYFEGGFLFYTAEGNRQMMVSPTGQVTLAAPHVDSRWRNRRR